ncbi:hypothetical protein H2203_005768 [Taxawa tesnikishii (nom. ined.)]|nr:hypothetical protein H2203_005768 [Dothideales sp. JES 119]
MLDRIRPHLALDDTALEAQKKEMLDPFAHDIGYAVGEIQYNHTKEYDAMGFPKARTPNRDHSYEMKPNEPATEYAVERIHPSVHFRQLYHMDLQKTNKKQKIYEPAAMKGWQRVEEDKGVGAGVKPRKGWKWVKHGTNGKVENSLWEFEMGDMPESKSVEKWLIDNSWCKSVHEEVQVGWKSG